MIVRSQSWFLLPHAVAVVCYLAALAWMTVAETNRTTADLSLAIMASVALALAVVASIAGSVLAFKRGIAHNWLWLLAHLAALLLGLLLATIWLGTHLV